MTTHTPESKLADLKRELLNLIATVAADGSKACVAEAAVIRLIRAYDASLKQGAVVDKLIEQHHFYARNGDLRMTTGDHLAAAKKLETLVSTLPAGDEGMVQVPASALRWLFGEEGDFECPTENYFRGRPPTYWWRSEFRKRIAARTAGGGK